MSAADFTLLCYQKSPLLMFILIVYFLFIFAQPGDSGIRVCASYRLTQNVSAFVEYHLSPDAAVQPLESAGTTS